MKIIAISLAFYLAMRLTLTNFDVIVSRFTKAIRKVDVSWEMAYGHMCFYWALFLLACLI